MNAHRSPLDVPVDHDAAAAVANMPKLIAAAREGGLSDAAIIVVLEDTVEGLDEGLSET
jgi:hypothetical protein